MIVIAVVNSKGGVGKTTLASALAVRAAEDSPRIALVDFDPQGSLTAWSRRREAHGDGDPNPCLFRDPTEPDRLPDPASVREALERDGWDWCILDSPPGFFETIEPLIEAADIVLIPLKTTLMDVEATEDAVRIAREHKTPLLCVLNDIGDKKGDERLAESARKVLAHYKLDTAKVQISHHAAHMQAINVGKSAAEVDGGRYKKAATELDDLWKELRARAQRAARRGRS